MSNLKVSTPSDVDRSERFDELKDQIQYDLSIFFIFFLNFHPVLILVLLQIWSSPFPHTSPVSHSCELFYFDIVILACHLMWPVNITEAFSILGTFEVSFLLFFILAFLHRAFMAFNFGLVIIETVKK